MNAQEIARIMALAYRDLRPWTDAEIERLLSDPSVLVRVVKDGFVLVRQVGDEGEVLALAVLPDAQRAGIGRGLMVGIMTQLCALGVSTLFLEVAAANSAALGLYHGLGFHECGRRKQYYQCADGTREDAIVMRASL